MSNDQKQKLSEVREWLNLFFTVAGAALIGYLSLWGKNQRLEIKNDADARYETIEAHQRDLIALNTTDGKQAEAVAELSRRHDSLERDVQKTKSETDLKIQHLTDVVLTRRDDKQAKN